MFIFATRVFTKFSISIFWAAAFLSFVTGHVKASVVVSLDCTRAIEKRSESLRAGLSNLILVDIDGYPKNKGYERKDRDQFPPEIDALYEEINELLSKMAAVFGMTLEEMFKNGIAISIRVSPIGPLSSNSETLGVFPSWTPQDGIRTWTPLVHEFAHKIASRPSRFGLPRVLRQINTFFLFQEFFADWLAYKTTGLVELDPVEVPGFPLRPSDVVSYSQSSRSFSNEYADVTFIRWALETQRKPEKSDFEKKLLQGFDISEEQAETFIRDVEMPPEAPLESLDNIRTLAQHSLGLPVLFFMRDLEIELGRSISGEFIRALHNLDQLDETDLMYEGFLEGYEEETEDYIHFIVKTPRHLFEQFRELFMGEERRAFDRLYQEREIEKGFLLEERAIVKNHVTLAVWDEIWKNFGENEGRGIGIYNPENRHYDPVYRVSGFDVVMVRRKK